MSPARILLRLMLVPVVASALTVSIYIRTSPFEPTDALRHLVAMTGCAAAAKVGVAPAIEGAPGYHGRNDPDGDGIACDRPATVTRAAPADTAPRASGAKFLRP